jgi:hypothetical protein
LLLWEGKGQVLRYFRVTNLTMFSTVHGWGGPDLGKIVVWSETSNHESLVDCWSLRKWSWGVGWTHWLRIHTLPAEQASSPASGKSCQGELKSWAVN